MEVPTKEDFNKLEKRVDVLEEKLDKVYTVFSNFVSKSEKHQKPIVLAKKVDTEVPEQSFYKKLYDYRKKRHQCVKCGKPAFKKKNGKHGIYCNKHRKMSNDYMKQYNR